MTFYMFKRFSLACFFLLIAISTQAQYINKSAEKKLLQHIQYLADDKLEGRLTGTPGEMMAAQYIIKKFILFCSSNRSYLEENLNFWYN